MPFSLVPSFPLSVIGIPEKPTLFFSSRRSFSVLSGLKQTGSTMKPCLYFWTVCVCTIIWHEGGRGEGEREREREMTGGRYSRYNVHVCRLHCNYLALYVDVNIMRACTCMNYCAVLTLTFLTSSDWLSMLQLWWIMPIPPISCRGRYNNISAFENLYKMLQIHFCVLPAITEMAWPSCSATGGHCVNQATQHGTCKLKYFTWISPNTW